MASTTSGPARQPRSNERPWPDPGSLPPDPAQQRAIRWLARRVVAGVAPEELPFFDPASDQFFAERRRRRWRHGDDRVLGYGWGDVIALVSPAALVVASTIVQKLVDRTGDAVLDRSGKVGGRLLRRAYRRWRARRSPTAAPDSPSGDADAAPVPVVAAAKVPEIRRLVEDAARAAGLPEERVERFVDEFVGALNIERAPTTDAPPPGDTAPSADRGRSADDHH